MNIGTADGSIIANTIAAHMANVTAAAAGSMPVASVAGVHSASRKVGIAGPDPSAVRFMPGPSAPRAASGTDSTTVAR